MEESVMHLRTTVAGFSGLELGKPERVYISLHASSQPGVQLLPMIGISDLQGWRSPQPNRLLDTLV
jgi:hypothetical protein